MTTFTVGTSGWCNVCGSGLKNDGGNVYCQDCLLEAHYDNNDPVQKPYVQTWAIASWMDSIIMPVEWVEADADPLTDPATIETPFEIIHCGNAELAAKVVQALNIYEADRAQDI